MNAPLSAAAAAPTSPLLRTRILQITDRTHDYVQGFDLAEEIARAFAGDTYHFTFGVLTGDTDPGLAQRIRCPVHCFRLDKKQLKPTRPATLLALLRFIRDHDIDVVITHRFKSWLLLSVVGLLLPQCRFIGVFHAYKQFDRRRRQWLARLLIDRRWRLVAVSQAVRGDLEQHGIPPANIAVIRNAIDVAGVRTALLSRSEARRHFGLADDAVVIATIGRTKAIKGHRFLVEAFARLVPHHPQLQLLIVGGGPEEEALRAQARELGVGARVTVTGTLCNAARFLRAADLFALPSLSEGIALVVLEAIAAGLPVVASRVGGVPEATGPEGVLVEPGDVHQLAGAMEQLLEMDAAQRRRYVRRLQQHLETQLGIDGYYRAYRALVQELLRQ